MTTFCINCGKKRHIFENGLCRKCATYLNDGINDDFILICPVWFPLMEKVRKYKKLAFNKKSW